MLSRIAVCLSIAVALLATPADAKNPVKRDYPTFTQPNIVVFLTDDQTLDAITGNDVNGVAFMPNVRAKLGLARKFNSTYFAESLCWPSRATLFTGQFPKNHGVDDQFENPYVEYMDRGLDLVSWPLALRQAGYMTGVYGKFINGTGGAAFATVGRPAGIHQAYLLTGSQAGSMYNWSMDRNGTVQHYSGAMTDPTVYTTDVLKVDFLQAINGQKNYLKPFAIMLSSTSPHLPADPSPAFATAYASEPCQPCATPAFNEANMSDKVGSPPPLLTVPQINDLTEKWRLTLASARSVDDAFKEAWDALTANGQLANTYIIFASDNGFMWGEHRDAMHKVVAWEPSIKSVTYVWGPDVIPGNDGRITSNIDWYRTFADIAGVATPNSVDGDSILPLLSGGHPGWRRAFMVQGLRPLPPSTPRANTNRTNYQALVTLDWKFVRYDSGEVEYYDLATDPDELVNKAPLLGATFLTAIQSKLDRHIACVGYTDCHTVEMEVLPVP